MERYQLFAYVAAVLVAGGFYALVALRHVLRKIVALNVMGSGVFLLLICIATRSPHPFPDPVPQAMVLTGIVVGLSVTALGLVLARRIHRETGEIVLSPAERVPQDEDVRE